MDSKSRIDTSVPKPADAKRLSESEKRALELSDEIEHEHGTKREQAEKQAKRLGEQEGKSRSS